ncbi:MAG: isoprenyl transferase [Chloroflexi bacterium]|nr:isoprenyl transferase [Chloroflexota bacterium]
MSLRRLPVHVAIIMDGNGRWAQARGLPRLAGHRAGTENLRHIIDASLDFGIKYLTVYAFSTENWARPKDEVEGLMNILEEVIDMEVPRLHEKGVRVRHIGALEGLRPELQRKIRESEALTRENQRMVLGVAFNYGGRAEIVHAVRRILAEGLRPEEVDEARFAQYLYTAGMPDPDLVIRTSGEQRISNFLLWQAAYAEWYFTPVYWPDFDREELRKALEEYSRRERRFGRVPNPKP